MASPTLAKNVAMTPLRLLPGHARFGLVFIGGEAEGEVIEAIKEYDLVLVRIRSGVPPVRRDDGSSVSVWWTMALPSGQPVWRLP